VYWREDSTRSRIWYYGALEEEGVQEAALGPPTVLCGGASGGQRLCCKACGRQPAPSLDPLVRVLLKISPSLRRGCPGPHHRTRPHEQGSRGVSAPSGHWYRGRPRSPESVGRPHCSEFSTHIALSLSLYLNVQLEVLYGRRPEVSAFRWCHLLPAMGARFDFQAEGILPFPISSNERHHVLAGLHASGGVLVRVDYFTFFFVFSRLALTHCS
jgi:hypothetical protein